ncbi:ribokinase [Enterobacillus tribolii]|uniref:Ribokinase n=1 Tax=Enterobacillus tribolii TaxID=1487935 RepID=A0A370QUS7_9GAMM|nr:ribokinase [Enterobacillus tribolii]MBW7980946.1 ribokinase [Enterobacillus tribolii]RDK92995.1 ribokinase [Enterobacillus tribolii]
MQKAKLVVLGSINADHILNVTEFPRPGETVTGQRYKVAFGGKGANQAVAAGRSGADIAFIACVGEDDIGDRIRQQLSADKIKTAAVEAVEAQTTGVALIFVNQDGENVIGISAGANACVTPDYLARYRSLVENADILLMQLESPLETIMAAAGIARQSGTQVILNPAPAQKLPDDLLALLDVITPNETEAEYLTGIAVKSDDDARRAAAVLHDKGIQTVIITLGSRGVWLSHDNHGELIPAFRVKAVDTIAAGDTFNGAMCTALLEGADIQSALRFAHAAAAIAVTREGAQPSVPWRGEIDAFLSQQE